MSIRKHQSRARFKRFKKYEVADVIRQFKNELSVKQTTVHQKRTLDALAQCRTAALGGHIDACDACGHLRISYNSCRNRHCPKCQSILKQAWIIQQEDMLLPIAYFHVVFTIPHQLNGLCLRNQKLLYNLLFKAAWHTLHTFSKDDKWLGAKTGATMVLHTWGQNLSLHPHLHCIVPNGGLTKDGKWLFPKGAKKGTGNFLFPVPAMKKVFKGFFMQHLIQLIQTKQLDLPPHFPSSKNDFFQWKNQLYLLDWVLFTKKPFSGVKHVVNYLARYSHRVAITNHRILDIKDGKVFFQYKDYKDGAKKKVMALKGVDFLKRFCLHILPPRFRKVRHFGINANAAKAKNINAARKALGCKQQALLLKAQCRKIAQQKLLQIKNQCPCCKKGQMKTIIAFPCNKDPPIGLNNFQIICWYLTEL